MSKGLGDIVETVLEKVGVKRVVERTATAVGIEDCGCSKRKAWLNEVGKLLTTDEDGATVELPGVVNAHGTVDPTSHESRRARNAAKRAAWEGEHGRPYGTPDPG